MEIINFLRLRQGALPHCLAQPTLRIFTMLRTVALQAATVRMARNTLVRAMASESRSVSFKLQTPFTTHRECCTASSHGAE